MSEEPVPPLGELCPEPIPPSQHYESPHRKDYLCEIKHSFLVYFIERERVAPLRILSPALKSPAGLGSAGSALEKGDFLKV